MNPVIVAILQYVISPLILAVVAGIGWLIRSYLHEIRHEVKNDHTTNLRADVDKIMAAVQGHHEHDTRLATAVARIEVAVSHHGNQLQRIEERFDAHMDKHS